MVPDMASTRKQFSIDGSSLSRDGSLRRPAFGRNTALRIQEIKSRSGQGIFVPIHPRVQGNNKKESNTIVRVWPFDQAWDVDSQAVASNLFASSIIPYAGFLYHLQRSKQAPKKMLFGFYFLLVFVFATIVAGITAKLKYGTILANVDWLHGSAESFLTITNLLIVLGLREGILEAEAKKIRPLADSSAEEKAKSR